MVYQYSVCIPFIIGSGCLLGLVYLGGIYISSPTRKPTYTSTLEYILDHISLYTIHQQNAPLSPSPLRLHPPNSPPPGPLSHPPPPSHLHRPHPHPHNQQHTTTSSPNLRQTRRPQLRPSLRRQQNPQTRIPPRRRPLPTSRHASLHRRPSIQPHPPSLRRRSPPRPPRRRHPGELGRLV